jgi:hypothetical protein
MIHTGVVHFLPITHRPQHIWRVPGREENNRPAEQKDWTSLKTANVREHIRTTKLNGDHVVLSWYNKIGNNENLTFPLVSPIS